MAEEQKIGTPIMSDEPVDIIEETDSDSDSDDEDFKKLENFDSRDILVDFHPHLQHISNKEKIINKLDFLIKNEPAPKEHYASVYSMNCTVDYKYIKKEILSAYDNLK